jgi:two-component system cell cycle response regulator
MMPSLGTRVETMKILLAEDHPVTRKMLAMQLRKWGYEVTSCADGTEAWAALSQEDAPRLVIMDWMMPGMDGVHICQEIRRAGKQPYVYVILLTSRNRPEDVVGGLEAGADDYIVKPFDPQELRVRVRAGSRVVQLQEDLLAALKASEFLASHDPLTRLWNRAAILEALRKELARAKREKKSVGIIMADVDHFKPINDEHGHLVGDAVLREIARRMVSAIRPYDSAGRYGGEEFLVVLPGTDAANALRLAERLRAAFDAEDLTTTEGSFHVTLSFGVATFDAEQDEDINPLIRAADEAMYRAKRCGRNRVEPCMPDTDCSADE